MYQVMRTMYRSAIRDMMLSEDEKIIKVVLPNMAAFRAIKQGMEILVKKKSDMKKQVEKLEREGKKANTGTINITPIQGGVMQAPSTAEPAHGKLPK